MGGQHGPTNGKSLQDPILRGMIPFRSPLQSKQKTSRLFLEKDREMLITMTF